MPARSAFGTSGLVNNGAVEIECMATLSKIPWERSQVHSRRILWTSIEEASWPRWWRRLEAMSSERLPIALEHHYDRTLDQAAGARSESDDGTPYRRGIGSVFVLGGSGDGVFAAKQARADAAETNRYSTSQAAIAPANHRASKPQRAPSRPA